MSGLRRTIQPSTPLLAGKKAPDKAPKAVAHLVAAAAALVARERIRANRLALGGRSYGGRMCSLAVAEGLPAAGLVLLSYPLHPPGSPERATDRTDHWPQIDCPVLLLSGESDPFAKIDLLRTAVGLLPNAELVTYPRLGHTLKPVLEDVLDRVAAFLREIEAAT